MSIIDTLITDRTAADAQRVREIAAKVQRGTASADEAEEYLSGAMRGAYNVSDFNRVTEACEYLADRLGRSGYTVQLRRRGQRWSMGQIPNTAELDDYLANVRAIRAAFNMSASAPRVPDSLVPVSADRANDLERVLQLVSRLLGLVAASYRRCGQFGFWSGVLPLPVYIPELPQPEEEGLQLCTADGLTVWTADGLAVYLAN